ncbi:MAG TPA: hypothetical protein VG675_03240 [Bryobacteraceae bacterium]|nr:hypothetical protein [Bryobacteraceae bacterium]
MDDPRQVYSLLLDERRVEIAAWQRKHRSLGYFKLLALAAALAVVWLALVSQAVSIVWVLVPVAVFAALMIRHERLLRAMELRERAARYFERGLERLQGRWAGHGEAGDRYLDSAHPYAQDLDLFGKGSLFELLCTARTHIGQDTLARWLLEPAGTQTVRARQEAIDELRPRVDLREHLAVLAEEAHTGVDSASLAAWGEAPPLLGQGHLHAAVIALTVLGIAGACSLCAVLLALGGVIPLPETTRVLLRDLFLFTLLVNGFFLHRIQERVARVAAAVEDAAHGLGLLSGVLVRLEQEQFRSPMLAALRASLETEGLPPSARMRRLRRLMENLDSRDNVFVRVAEVFIFWSAHTAFGVEAWRRRSGPGVRRWTAATGEIEALCSLASHAFEHPADPFPDLQDGPALFDAEAVGHPLIVEERMVRNSVRVGGELRVIVVSGSNMSGKSTLLRTVGINAVLAQAGAPVRAQRLRMSPLAVGASIRVVDSLQGGVSRFYAEILRLRQILNQTAGQLPVLFLIDEFLHGTNSHDRKIGAEAMVRGLVERGAIGFITTHDLALAEIAESLGPRAANVHFADRVEDGHIYFDYVMRPGVVRKSNALELMRSVGLEI